MNRIFDIPVFQTIRISFTNLSVSLICRLDCFFNYFKYIIQSFTKCYRTIDIVLSIHSIVSIVFHTLKLTVHVNILKQKKYCKMYPLRHQDSINKIVGLKCHYHTVTICQTCASST